MLDILICFLYDNEVKEKLHDAETYHKIDQNGRKGDDERKRLVEEILQIIAQDKVVECM